jgi:uncharacterized protein DUF2865
MPSDYVRHAPILCFTIGLAAGLMTLPSGGAAQIGYQFISAPYGANVDESRAQPPARYVARPALRYRNYAVRPYRHDQARAQEEPSDRRRSVSSDESSSHPAVCVRLCDGRFFPLPPATTSQANTLCAAACPNATVAVFRGSSGNLKDATDGDGKPYSALPNAFAYRSRLPPACSCQGDHKPGMASVAVEKDPTLEPGDIVVTPYGQLVFHGKPGEEQHAFMPAEK